MPLPKSKLLALMTAAALCASSFSSYAQSTDLCDPVIRECESLLEEMAQTRDEAIQTADAVETERDVEAGKRLTFEQLYYDERRAAEARNKKPRVPDWVWVTLGAGGLLLTEIVVAVLIIML